MGGGGERASGSSAALLDRVHMSERDRAIARTELRHAEFLVDLIVRAAADLKSRGMLVQSSVGALARRISREVRRVMTTRTTL